MNIKRIIGISTLITAIMMTSTVFAYSSESNISKKIANSKKVLVKKDTNTEGKRKESNVSPFSTLITSGAITEVQAEAIQTAFKIYAESNEKTDPTEKQAELKTLLDSLVAAGKITQTVENAVLNSKTDVKSKEKNKIGREGKGRKVNCSRFSALVTSGIITQANADVIEAALKAKMDNDKSIKQTEKQAGFKIVLDKLVTAGTITQAQEEAILKIMDSRINRK
jgi:hypothetical protein